MVESVEKRGFIVLCTWFFVSVCLVSWNRRFEGGLFWGGCQFLTEVMEYSKRQSISAVVSSINETTNYTSQ